MYKPTHMTYGDRSASYAALGTANSVTVIPIPGSADTHNRPRAFRIWFEDGSGAPVRGRLGLAGADFISPTVTDTNDQLGHIPATIEDQFQLPPFAKNLIVASNTASAKVFVTWLYPSA
jgi:hypothetical protein